MKKQAIDSSDITMSEVDIDNELFYKISNVNCMRPFFMSIVSNSNHWMFVSSNGGISAGRTNADYALFPYYTDDKITESVENTGSKTIIRITENSKEIIWEPFSIRSEYAYSITRNLYKSALGNSIIYEEINNDLSLRFSYQWKSSDEYGFVKISNLENLSGQSRHLTVLDGLLNIMPACIGSDLQNGLSNLVDAYKRSELDIQSGLGIFALSAVIIDRAEPSEALFANTVWSSGLNNPTYLLSSRQLDRFRRGKGIEQEVDNKGERGAYLITSDMEYNAGENKQWIFIANVHQHQSAVIQLIESINNNAKLQELVLLDCNKGSEALYAIAMSADGIQVSSDSLIDSRHYANVLFNSMRGGIFYNQYSIDTQDFCEYIQKANRNVYQEMRQELNALPCPCNLSDIHALIHKSQTLHFERIALEYLPLTFSRRHGDPSRPWNKFSINTKKDDGSIRLDYQGNWRDIFQNWEALVHSYPYFIEGMIRKFLNASTFDGYNPYRVQKDGFDWETIEAHNPWSYIGYWGDHQIIYLLKLLEFSHQVHPEWIHSLFDNKSFVYAHIPYQIKSYEDILVNPKNTIDFIHDEDIAIRNAVKTIGSDGAILRNASREIYQVEFVEKILATILARLTNMIPEGGIWMNTQRPEWNDANNALVGNGVSMVTLYYLRRFISFFLTICNQHKGKHVDISIELYECFQSIHSTLQHYQQSMKQPLQDSLRKEIVDGLGKAGSKFRNRIYNHSFSGKTVELSIDSVLELFECTLEYLNVSIQRNKREDGLYHAYNLLTLRDSSASLSYLPQMLEGQVAVLSSGYISVQESVALLDAMRNSSLYRTDQQSYMLYPNKELAGFLKKNTIPKYRVESSQLLQLMLKNGNTSIIERDIRGDYHFNAQFRNVDELVHALAYVEEPYQSLVIAEQQDLVTVYEEVFQHKAFTGRSGTFFGYEGLGSLYWHMVSKLRYAVQEMYIRALEEKADRDTIYRLLAHYKEITEGLGVHKSPELYGAFPTDPYSHTPFGRGAQQPGMTGQVKEDILCRMRELGVQFNNGCLRFNPTMIGISDFLPQERTVFYQHIHGTQKQIALPKNSLFFTVCQVPVIYTLGTDNQCTIHRSNGLSDTVASLELSITDSTHIFSRNGSIDSIHIVLNKEYLQ